MCVGKKRKEIKEGGRYLEVGIIKQYVTHMSNIIV